MFAWSTEQFVYAVFRDNLGFNDAVNDLLDYKVNTNDKRKFIGMAVEEFFWNEFSNSVNISVTKNLGSSWLNKS